MGFLRTIVAGLLLLLATGTMAHETLIAPLDIQELGGGAYLAGWRFSSDRNIPPPEAVFPGQCRFEKPRLECGEAGLTGTLSVAGLGERYSGAVVRLRRLDGTVRSFTLTPEQPKVTLTADGTAGWAQVAGAYIPLGIEHILLGVDHLLFVLGLMWLVGSGWMLVRTITAFTIAHSITLAAATLGWVGVPEGPVNASIALSIVFVALEVIRQQRGTPGLTSRYPWLVAFGFGLLHGFGFAGALTRLGLPPEQIPAALLFFNVGVEIGQLAFVLLVLLLVRAHRALGVGLPSRVATLPASLMGGVGTFWFGGRLVALLAA